MAKQDTFGDVQPLFYVIRPGVNTISPGKYTPIVDWLGKKYIINAGCDNEEQAYAEAESAVIDLKSLMVSSAQLHMSRYKVIKPTS